MTTHMVKAPFSRIGRMMVLFLGLFMFTGLTGCEQAEKTMEKVSESAEQAVDTVKEKADAVLAKTEADADDEESEEDDKND